MRIDKFLSDAGLGTRKEVRLVIKSRAVSVNGRMVVDAGFHIDPERDAVTVKGVPVAYRRFHYYMLHKPSGVVSATEDERERTVLDLLPLSMRKGISPVGRLDKDTTGLLLLTDDGALSHRLLSPKHHVDKTYLVNYSGTLPADAEERAAKGLRVDADFTALPARLTRISDGEARIIIQEGKFHQVKRMFCALGCEVVRLKRVAMGPLRLDEELKEGEYRPLQAEEIAALLYSRTNEAGDCKSLTR